MSEPCPDPRIKKKRIKVTLACLMCRKKKVKCNGAQPNCSRCEAKGLDCEYIERNQRRGPLKRHGDIIENRAKRVAKLHSHNRSVLDSHSPLTIAASPTPPPSYSNKSSHYAEPLDQEDAVATHSPVEPRSPPSLTLYHLTKDNAMLQLVMGAVKAIKDKWEADYLLTGGPLPTSNNTVVPHSVQIQLAEKYFNNFNLFLPLLSKHHFFYRLMHHPDHMDPMLCYAVCAMGTRYFQYRDDLERLYFEQCMAHFDNLKDDQVTLSSLQAVVIMCWYTFLMGDFKKSAELQSHLVRLVRLLRLGKNAEPTLTMAQQELRRRTFWSIYVTDGLLSFYTDMRLINMEKEGWDIKKPILEDDQLKKVDHRELKWTMPQPAALREETTEASLQMASFTELIELAGIMGDMYECHRYGRHASAMTKDASHLEPRLNDWFLHLPSYLEYNPALPATPQQLPVDRRDTPTSSDKPNRPEDPAQPPSDLMEVDNEQQHTAQDEPPAPIAKTIRILYHTAQIILHQSGLAGLDQQSSLAVCRRAADGIIHIADQMLQSHEELNVYNIFTMSVTLAASIHLDLTMALRPLSAHLKDRLGRSMRVLKEANCSYMSKMDFDRLLDRYLTNRCKLVLTDAFRSKNQLGMTQLILERARQPTEPLPATASTPRIPASPFLPPPPSAHPHQHDRSSVASHSPPPTSTVPHMLPTSMPATTTSPLHASLTPLPPPHLPSPLLLSVLPRGVISSTNFLQSVAISPWNIPGHHPPPPATHATSPGALIANGADPTSSMPTIAQPSDLDGLLNDGMTEMIFSGYEQATALFDNLPYSSLLDTNHPSHPPPATTPAIAIPQTHSPLASQTIQPTSSSSTPSSVSSSIAVSQQDSFMKLSPAQPFADSPSPPPLADDQDEAIRLVPPNSYY